MDTEMAYMVGMILGNGEVQRGTTSTKISIEIPFKNLYTEDGKNIAVYVKASIVDIRNIVEPLVGHSTWRIVENGHSTIMTLEKHNDEYVTREILRLIGSGSHHTTMKMAEELFNATTDEKKSLLRGIADVTGYIRRSNIAFGQDGAHRVYIEIPANWHMVIDIANMLKDVDVPIQTIDFGHPNFRDPQLDKYNKGQKRYWVKEHQIKIFANEFLPIGFNVKHKQEALQKYSEELLEYLDPAKTHKFYWEKKFRATGVKPIHPAENDSTLPPEIRGKHFNTWTELAEFLGYGK